MGSARKEGGPEDGIEHMCKPEQVAKEPRSYRAFFAPLLNPAYEQGVGSNADSHPLPQRTCAGRGQAIVFLSLPEAWSLRWGNHAHLWSCKRASPDYRCASR
jgi:hypothetical protein